MDTDDDSFDNSEAGSLISKSGMLTESKHSTKKKKNAKKIQKSLKGSVIKQQVEENLGANEEDGINNAFQKQESALSAAQKIRKQLRDPNANNE